MSVHNAHPARATLSSATVEGMLITCSRYDYRFRTRSDSEVEEDADPRSMETSGSLNQTPRGRGVLKRADRNRDVPHDHFDRVGSS